MRGTEIFISSALFATVWLTGATLAAADSEFPLDIGNQWVYRSRGFAAGQAFSVEVVTSRLFGGRAYMLVHGFPSGDAWLRMSETGVLSEWRTRDSREVVWADFSAPPGGSYRSEIDACSPVARVASRTARYRGPLGEFPGAFEIQYPPSGCADAGLTQEFYVRGVGLVERTMNTIGGPRIFEMIYARIGDVTVYSMPEAGSALSLDRGVYRAGTRMTARLTLRNPEGEPSGVRAWVVTIWNENGDAVLEVRREREEAEWRGEHHLVADFGLADGAGRALPPGRYVAEARSATYAARVPFEVAE